MQSSHCLSCLGKKCHHQNSHSGSPAGCSRTSKGLDKVIRSNIQDTLQGGHLDNRVTALRLSLCFLLCRSIYFVLRHIHYIFLFRDNSSIYSNINNIIISRLHSGKQYVPAVAVRKKWRIFWV